MHGTPPTLTGAAVIRPSVAGGCYDKFGAHRTGGCSATVEWSDIRFRRK
ncbi:hypothetical protein [Streptomyces sp. NPDC020965]